MTVNTTKITGFIVLPNDTIREQSKVIFTMTGFDTDADDNATVVPIPIEAPIAVDGSIDVDMWPNPEGVRTTFYRVTFSIYNGNSPILVDGGLISVPVSGGPYDLNDLLPVSPPSGATVDEYIAQLASAVTSAEDAAATAVAAATPAQVLIDNIRVTRDTFAELASITVSDISANEWAFIVETGQWYQYVTSGEDFTSGLTWKLSRASGVFTLAQFGCSTATADNGPLIDTAINAARNAGVILDGQHIAYPITTSMTAVPGRVRNMNIDASGLTATAAWQPVANAYEASKSLASDTLQGSRDWNITAHGYSVGDVILFTSDQVFETATSARCAHWARVSSVVDANNFTTYEPALCNLTTAQNAIARRLPRNNTAEVDVKITGGANCKNGFWPIRFTDLKVTGEGENLAQRAFIAQECYAPEFITVRAIDSDEAGLGYGVALAGSGQTKIRTADGIRCRHVVTFGASGTIPCIGGTVGDVIADEALSGAFDTHPACIGVYQTGKTVCSLSDEYAGEDGIVVQGVNGSVNVQFTGGQPSRHGVLVQPFHDMAAFEIAPSYEVVASGIDALNRGVAVDITACGDVYSIDVDATGKSVNEVVYVDIGAIAVENINISGSGASTAGRAMRVICVATSDLAFVSQSGKWSGLNEVIYILGQTDAGSRTTEWAVSLAKSSGGTYGLRATNKVNAIVGAAFMSGSTGATVATGGATVTVLT